MPRRTLFILTLAVLLVHAWLLGVLQWRLAPATQDAPAWVFDTRMLAPPAPPALPVADAAPQAAVAPPSAKPKRRHPRPKPPVQEVQEAPASPAPPPDHPTPLPGIDPALALLGSAPEEPDAAFPGTVPDAAPDAAQGQTAPEDALSQQIAAAAEAAPASTPAAEQVDAPPAVHLPPSATLEFDVAGQVKGFQYRASARLSWRQEGDRYEAQQKISAFLLGSRQQRSAGRIVAAGLVPQQFVDAARRERTAQFDDAAHTVRLDGQPQDVPLPPGAQDRLSVFIQLGALLAAAPERYPPGAHIAMTVVGARNVQQWVFSVQGPEELDLPVGPTPALKLQRLPREAGDQKAELWLGTQQGYLPVRIRLSEDNGDFADLRLEERAAP